MSWIQTLYDTYEQCVDAPQFANDPPLPMAHTTQQAHIEIVIDGHGQFRRAIVVPKEDCTTRVPCTEQSGGRSGSKPVNHPLSDKLQYVAGDFADFGGTVTVGFANPGEPFQNYVTDLKAWAGSPHGHSKVSAILAYVLRRQTIRDLVGSRVLPVNSEGNLLKEWTGDRNSKPAIFGVIKIPENSFVRWSVEMPENPSSGTWDDRTLVDAWSAYYASRQVKRGFCMVTGVVTTLAEQHPAKIRNAGDKAKLISSNDSSGFTFRGRFANADEACSVGFEVTQKAHGALRWLIGRGHAQRSGDQVTVTWATAGKPVPDPFWNSASLFLAAEELPTTLAVGPGAGARSTIGDAGQAFAGRLNKAIAGYRVRLGPTDQIVVLTVDSATPGRLAIAFYRELTGSEFLARVLAWHAGYVWHQDFGWDATRKQHARFLGAPSPRDIADAAYGPPRKTDQKRSQQKATVVRLLPCIVDGREVPRDLVESAVRRTCNRAGFERDRKGNEYEWEKNLGITCALLKGYFKFRNYRMTLEADRTTRDYLYGRLLALAERTERVALSAAGETRETNAARLMQRFADRPASTWRSIELSLAPYRARLRVRRPGFLFNIERRLDEVMNTFRTDEFLDDRKLTGEFLLGYHCERAFKPDASIPPDSTTNEAIPGENS